MKITRKQTLRDGVYSVIVSCNGYGRRDLTAEEEQEVIENFGSKIVYKDIDFSGTFKVENGDVKEDMSGDSIELELNNQEVELNDHSEFQYSVKLNTIKDSMLGSNLTTKEKVASAMCVLFGNRIEEAITEVIDEAVAKTDNFESIEEKTI